MLDVLESVLYIIAAYFIVEMGGILFNFKKQRGTVPCALCYLFFGIAKYVYHYIKSYDFGRVTVLVLGLVIYLFSFTWIILFVYKKTGFMVIYYNIFCAFMTDVLLIPFGFIPVLNEKKDLQMVFMWCIMIMSFAVMIKAIRKKKREQLVHKVFSSVPKRVYFLLAVFLFALAMTNTGIKRSSDIEMLFNITWIVVVISGIALAISSVMIAVSEHQKQENVDLLSKQLDTQLHYYEKINDIYGEFRSFRHDYKNHMLCVESLLDRGEYDKAKEYMRSIEGMTKERTNKFSTGNVIVDALLDDKQDRADLSNTTIEFSGRMPSEGITNIDLCTVVANAVDNAIEACEKGDTHERKSIQITSAVDKGCFFFKISNPMYDTVKIKDGNKVTTSKEDSTRHGFGVANIVSTAEKYSGSAELSAADGVFTLEADLVLGSV
ncbi:MAG: GHKL domain-containing protein [Ruminococcus sp.]|nr:GHKL domain-containing protein [Ruminococcus sp.]